MESPMCVTAWQEVRSEAAGTGALPAEPGPAGAPPEPFAEPPAPGPPFPARPALVPLVLDPLVPESPWPPPPGAGRTEPEARVPVAALLATGARTAPLSPA